MTNLLFKRISVFLIIGTLIFQQVPLQIFAESHPPVKKAKTTEKLSLTTDTKAIKVGETFFVDGEFDAEEVTMKLPAGIHYEDQKTKHEFDKKANTITLKKEENEQKVKIALKAERAGTYTFQLLAAKAEKSEELKINATAKKNTKALDNEILPELSTVINKNKFSHADDKIEVTTSVKYNNSFNSFDKGKITIQLPKTVTLVSYANVSKTSGVKSADYDPWTNVLIFTLEDTISSGAIIPLSYVITPSPSAAENQTSKVVTTASGDINNEGITPIQVESEPIYFENIMMPEAGQDDWKLSTKNAILLPGANDTTETILKRNKLSNISHLKIRYITQNHSDVESVFDISTKAPQINGFSVVPKVTVIDEHTLEYDYGSVNGNLQSSVRLGYSMKAPANALPGDEFDMTAEVYNGTEKISTSTQHLTVKKLETDVRMKAELQGTEPTPGGKFALYIGLVGNFSTKVKDTSYEVEVPTGTRLETIAPPVTAANVNRLTKVEYKESRDDTWRELPPKTLGTNPTYDFAGIQAKQVKVTNAETATSSSSTFVFTNKTHEVGDTISIHAYKGTFQSPETGELIEVEDITTPLTVVEKKDAAPTVELININSIASNSNDRGDFDTDIRKIGDSWARSYRLSVTSGSLEDPYIFAIVPKGIKVEELKNSILATNYAANYAYLPGFSTSLAPHSMEDKGSVELKDGRTLYYFKAPNTTIEKIRNRSLVDVDLRFTAETPIVGEYQSEIGLGSLTQNKFTPKIKGSYKEAELDAEVKQALQAEADNYFSLKQTLAIKGVTSIESKVLVKGSEDKNYIDASSGTATTIPGKTVDYKVTMKNNGTTRIKNFEMIDILPHIGDKLIASPTVNRGSEFAVNATDDFALYINGKEEQAGLLEFSPSTDPARFFLNGSDHLTSNEWSVTKPEQIASVKVSLVDKDLLPGDEIELVYRGIVPVDAPRNGERAVNTIAYRGISEGNAFGAEPVTAKVQSTKPLTDLEIGGQVYGDFNKDGSKATDELGINKVQMELYRLENGVYVPTGETIETANNSADKAGFFNFSGLTEGKYRIKVTKPKSASFITIGDNSTEPIDETTAWIKYHGKTDITIDSLGINPEKVTDIQIPLYTATPLKGHIWFVDKDGELIPSKYGEGYRVILKDEAGQEVSTTTAKEDGSYKFEELGIKKAGKYTLEFEKPTGTSFVSAPKNPTKWEITLTPFIGKAETDLTDCYITDTDAPSGTILIDNKRNPEKIKIEASDKTTETTVRWEIKNATGEVVYAGTKQTIEEELQYLLADKTSGLYTITATITDMAKNQKIVSESFTILAESGTIQTAHTTVPFEIGDPAWTKADYLEKYGITAKDALENAIPVASITIDDDKVDYSEPGNYIAVIRATDSVGQASTKTITILVQDTTPPVIAILNGSKMTDPIVFNTNTAAFQELTEQTLLHTAGVSATDNYDKTLTNQLLRKAGITFQTDFDKATLLPSKEGTGYQINVHARDSSGNQTAAPSPVYVKIQDNTAPTFDTQNIRYTVNQQVDEAAFLQAAVKKAHDDFTPAAELTLTSDFDEKVNVTRAGNYEVAITVTDGAGNQTTKRLTVRVASTEQPVITGKSEWHTEVHLVWSIDQLRTKLALHAANDTFADVPVRLTLPAGLDFHHVGTYTVIATAVDEDGNEADPYPIKLNVVDTTKPVLQTSKKTITYPVNEKISEATFLQAIGAKVTDNYDTTLTIQSDWEDAAINQIGSQTVTLHAKDRAGNEADPITIQVQRTDTSKPKIQVGKQTLVYPVGTAVNQETLLKAIRANVTDNYDTAVELQVTQQINWHKVGSYHVRLTAKDASGNQAEPVVVEVKVVDNVKPTLTTVRQTMDYEVGKKVSDKQFLQDVGARTTDNYDQQPVIQINWGKRNWNKAGTYTVTLIATDSSGNQTTVSLKVRLSEKEERANDPKPPKKDKTSTPPKKGVSEKSSSKGKNSTLAVNEKPRKMPLTGDTVNILLLATGLSLLFAGIALKRKRRN